MDAVVKTIRLHFQGSLSFSDKDRLPSFEGVYLVYRGVWSEKDRLFYCHEIMYIGKAENINKRHQCHERERDFISRCRPGEIVFYSYAEVAKQDVDLVEAALIYHTKPALNLNEKNSFLFGSTRVVSDGACALLDSDFLIENETEYGVEY